MPNNLKALNTFFEPFNEGVVHRSIPPCSTSLFATPKPFEINTVNGLRESSPSDIRKRIMLKSLRAHSGVLDFKALSSAQSIPDDNMNTSDARLRCNYFPEEAICENRERGERNGDISWTEIDINNFLRSQSNLPLSTPCVGLRNRLNGENGIFEIQNITFVHDKSDSGVPGSEWNGIAENVPASKRTSPHKDKQPQVERLSCIGHKGEEFKEFDEPVGVTFNQDGDIIIADCNNDRLQVFSNDGNFIRVYDRYSRESGKLFPFRSPAGVACDASGNIAVAEKGKNRVVVLSPAGIILHAFGRHGREQGQFRGPHGVSVDARSRIIVTDTMNCRVQVFDHEGNYLFMFGNQGPGKLNYPCYAIFHEGRFYVADTDNDSVKVFDTRGTFLRTFGDNFSAPSGIAVYKDKYLLICDYSNDCLKVFSLEGRMLSKFGTMGEGNDQFFGPEAVAVNLQGKIAVSDKLNCRIQILDIHI